MKCISDELIQKYIDNETSENEEAYIKNHFEDCGKCAEKAENMRQIAGYIKQLIRSLNEREAEIPKFNKTVQKPKVIKLSYKRIIYAVSAACLLIVFLLLYQKPNDEIEIEYLYDLESEYNANLPVSEQEMGIQIIDSEGKLIKY